MEYAAYATSEFRSAGFEVLNIASFCIESDLDMYRLPPNAIRGAILRYTDKEADGAFVSCTAIRAAETLEAAEQVQQRPVLSAAQAFFWQILRSAGYVRLIEGYGRLFRRQRRDWEGGHSPPCDRTTGSQVLRGVRSLACAAAKLIYLALGIVEQTGKPAFDCPVSGNGV